MHVPAPRGAPLAGLLLLVGGLVACAAPRPPQDDFVALEPPVPSPPGEFSAAERLDWWEARLPQLAPADRLEARLCMGELLLELRRAEEARFAFFEVLGNSVTAREAARAERGIGLSHFLDGQPVRGISHLENSLRGLESPAAAEVAHLLAVVRGRASGADAALSARMQTYLEPAGLLAVAAPPPPAAKASFADVNRSQWNAQPMRANHDPMSKPFRITVHHTAEPLTSEALSASCAEIRHIQGMHVQQGWADVGYHFFVDRAGRVIEGRTLEAQGAHAGDSASNRGNIGIALLGNFVSQPSRGEAYVRAQSPSPAQMEALDRLTDALIARYGIAAREIWAHEHFRETECPGPQLRAWADARRAGRGGSGASPASARNLNQGK
jgi:hypothetical protein